ncbi:MAG TPA: TonB family protein [Clostridia bacterium]|nr:TonB family protein [Clostridia bacterium]
MATFEIPPRPPDPGQPGSDHLRRSGDEAAEFAPVLLSQLQDDLARSRMREAFWISVVVHILLVLTIALAPKYMPHRGYVQVATAEDLLRNKELTYLELPSDQQAPPPKPPDTKFMSDKNRIATSRAPQLDKKTLEDLRPSPPPGPPGPPEPQQSARATPAAPPPQGGQQAAQQPGGTPSANSNSPFTAPANAAKPNPFGGAMSAGTSIAEAARNSARAGYGGAAGDFGIGPAGSPGKIRSNMDVLSDTMGVDFGPYLSRVLQAVRMNWYTLIPEVARAPLMKRGKSSIEFAILKDGRVAGMRMVGPSGDVSLDRAAWGGITASNPFPPLPGEFHGPYLALRFHFYYNPDKNDMQ